MRTLKVLVDLHTSCGFNTQNLKSSPTSCLFFLFLLPGAVFGHAGNSFLLLFHHSLLSKRVTKIGHFHWIHRPMFLSVLSLNQHFVYAT